MSVDDMEINDENLDYTSSLIGDAHRSGGVLTKHLYEAMIYWKHEYVKKSDHSDIQVRLLKLGFDLTNFPPKA